MTNRIPEIALILPSLYLMQLNGGKITTSQLIQKLRLIMRPTGEDLEILSGRSDDKFLFGRIAEECRLQTYSDHALPPTPTTHQRPPRRKETKWRTYRYRSSIR